MSQKYTKKVARWAILKRNQYFWASKNILFMKKSLNIYVLALCFLFFSLSPLQAQRRYKKQQKKEMHTASYDSLFNAYQFQMLKDFVLEDIETATAAKAPTDLQDSVLLRAEKGLAMLRSVERVVITDSVVVGKADFFKHYPLSESCGSIGMPTTIIPKIKTGNASSTVYLNDFGDIVYFPMLRNGKSVLCKSHKIAEVWQNPTELYSPSGLGQQPAFPYLMSDGTTLYFAAKGEDSFGGYDIFVTRYNPDTEEYLKPENIGMPFNSPANDYLYVIDESNKIGWFATDRAQAEDSVCIYTFIPQNPRKYYTPEATPDLSALARITSIKMTQKKKMRQATANVELIRNNAKHFRFPINDGLIYTDIQQFTSSEATELARQWQKESEQLKQLEKSQVSMLKLSSMNSSDAAVKNEIGRIEEDIVSCRLKMAALEKQIRNTEIENLEKNKK